MSAALRGSTGFWGCLGGRLGSRGLHEDFLDAANAQAKIGVVSKSEPGKNAGKGVLGRGNSCSTGGDLKQFRLTEGKWKDGHEIGECWALSAALG